jgi:hypothetical protein
LLPLLLPQAQITKARSVLAENATAARGGIM